MSKYKKKKNGNGAKKRRAIVRFYKKIDHSQSGKGYVMVPRYFKNAFEIFFGEMDLASAIEYFNIIFKSKGQRQKKRSWSPRDLLELRRSFHDKSADMINWYSNGNGRRMDRHHVIPKSRGGGSGDNLLPIPRFFHETYHALFGNLTPCEVVYFMEIIFTGKGLEKAKKKWTPKELYEQQLKIQLESLSKKK